MNESQSTLGKLYTSQSSIMFLLAIVLVNVYAIFIFPLYEIILSGNSSFFIDNRPVIGFLDFLIVFVLNLFLFLFLGISFEFRLPSLFLFIGSHIIGFLGVISETGLNIIFYNLWFIIYWISIYLLFRAQTKEYFKNLKPDFEKYSIPNLLYSKIQYVMDIVMFIGLAIVQLDSILFFNFTIPLMKEFNYITLLPLVPILILTMKSIFEEGVSFSKVIETVQRDDSVEISGNKEKISRSLKEESRQDPILDDQIRIKTEITCTYTDREDHNSCVGKTSYVCHHCTVSLCEEHAYVFIDREFPKIETTDGYIIDKGKLPSRKLIILSIILYILAVTDVILFSIISQAGIDGLLLIPGNILALIAIYIVYTALGKYRVEASFQRTLQTKYGAGGERKEGLRLLGFFYGTHCWNCLQNDHKKLFKSVVDITEAAKSSNIRLVSSNATRIADNFIKGYFSNGSLQHHDIIRINNWTQMKKFSGANQLPKGILYGFDTWRNKDGEIVTPKLWRDPNDIYNLKDNYRFNHPKIKRVLIIVLLGTLSVIPPFVTYNLYVDQWETILIVFGIIDAIIIIVAAFISLKYFYTFEQHVIRDGIFNPEENLIAMAVHQKDLITHIDNCSNCSKQVKRALTNDGVWNHNNKHIVKSAK